MTRITSPVTRESATLDRGKPLIVTLHPKYLELRAKNERKRWTIPYEACLWLAVKKEQEGALRDNAPRLKRRK